MYTLSSSHTEYKILLLLTIFSLGFVSATFANGNFIAIASASSSINDQTLTLQLSKSAFDLGDLVVVEGLLEDSIDDYIQFSVHAPDGKIYKDEQVLISDDEFQYLFKLPIDLAFVGEWQITAQFEIGGQNHTATKLFGVQNPYDDKMSLLISDIEYKKSLGQPVSIIQALKPILVSVSVSNYAPFDQRVTTIVEIIDSSDSVVLLGFQTDDLPGHDSDEYGFSWIPESKGTYVVKVFTIKSLEEPMILSDGSSEDVIVV